MDTETPTVAGSPPYRPGRPWPGAAKAEAGRLYFARSDSGHDVFFILSRQKVGKGKEAYWTAPTAAGYAATPTGPDGRLTHFDGLTLRELAAFLKSHAQEAQA